MGTPATHHLISNTYTNFCAPVTACDPEGMAASIDLVVPPGYTLADMDTWSYLCATDQHGDCPGRYINPDPNCSSSKVELPCTCGICQHDQTLKKSGRPRKNPA